MKDNEGQDSVNRIKAVKNRDNFKLKKVNKIHNFRIKFMNFPGEKGRFGCLLRS